MQELIRAKEIVLVPLSEIKLNPKNRNKHPKEQIDHLVKIIRGNGFRRPGTISNQSGYLVCGEGRYHAAMALGLTHMPCMFQDYDSPELEYADGIADNALDKQAELDLSGINADLGDLGPDFDIDMLGLKDFVLEPAEKLEPQSDEDTVPEPTESIAKLGDVFQLGDHRLVCGDSTNVCAIDLLTMGEKADMVFTDPPYGVAVQNTQGGILGDEDLTVFKDSLPMLKAFAKESAHFYVWCASGDRLPESISSFAAILPFQNLLPIRCTHENKRGKKGAFKLNYETCLFGNDNTKSFNPSDKFKVSETTLNDSRYKGDGKLRVYPALWDGERSTEHNMNIVHPTQKKVEMIEFYLEISSNENESVLDLFGGSGSTLIACEKTNRRCFMMELDPHYCDVIVARWEKYTGKKAERITTQE